MENSKSLDKASSRIKPPKPFRMNAAVIVSPGRTDYFNVPIPTPADNEVLIKLEGCGICSSDLPVWEGRPWFQYPYQPGAPGHEGYGIVEVPGEKVNHLKKGDRVAMLSYHAYAEYDVANADEVFKLPDYMSNMPFPGEPLGCAMNIFNRSLVTKKDTVAVLGAGFIGNLLIQLCKSAGARVIAISRRESSLKMAFESGADYIIPLDDHDRVLQRVNEITNFQGCTRVIEATGKQWPLDIAGEITGIKGRMIIAGYHQDGLRQINLQNWNWKGIDVINAHERDPQEYLKGMQLAADEVKKGTLNPLVLFTHQYGFEQLNSAFRDMSQGKDGFIKGIVRMF